MLQLKNLTIRHKKDLRPLLEDFSFTLNEGDKAVIISEEGNGKSTLLKLIYDKTLVEDYVEYTGEIIKRGIIFGYLPQEFPPEYKDIPVYSFCCQSEGFLNATPKQLASAASRLQLDSAFFYSEQPCGTLSGGEKVKLQLSLLCLTEPDIYLLDEPSNDIDIETLQWLEDFISTCPRPVLYVSHDEMLIERTANVIIHLEQIMRKTKPRHTIARMPYPEYISRREDAFARQEQQARNERREYDKQMARFRQIEQKVETMQNNISRQDPHGGRLLKKKMKAVKSQEHRFEREKGEMTQLPDMEKAIFLKIEPEAELPRSKIVLDYHCDALVARSSNGASSPMSRQLSGPISLRVTGPEKICIVGRNGVGKTTLLRQIAQALLPRQDLKVSYMPQDYEELLELKRTPVDYLTRTGDKEERTRIRTYLGSMRYTADEMNHPIQELSGGQKAKLLFLKMSLEGTNCLILDEPTRNFSPLSGPVIRQVLQDFPGAIISVSHDRKYISQVCSRLLRLTECGLEEISKPADE